MLAHHRPPRKQPLSYGRHDIAAAASSQAAVVDPHRELLFAEDNVPNGSATVAAGQEVPFLPLICGRFM
jgi:hypothetical protein